jgi:hypothetical protein
MTDKEIIRKWTNREITNAEAIYMAEARKEALAAIREGVEKLDEKEIITRWFVWVAKNKLDFTSNAHFRLCMMQLVKDTKKGVLAILAAGGEVPEKPASKRGEGK